LLFLYSPNCTVVIDLVRRYVADHRLPFRSAIIVVTSRIGTSLAEWNFRLFSIPNVRHTELTVALHNKRRVARSSPPPMGLPFTTGSAPSFYSGRELLHRCDWSIPLRLLVIQHRAEEHPRRAKRDESIVAAASSSFSVFVSCGCVSGRAPTPTATANNRRNPLRLCRGSAGVAVCSSSQ